MPVLDELRRSQGTVAAETALPPGLRGLPAHRAVRRRHRDLSARARGSRRRTSPAGTLPARLTIEASLAQGLRYGENPHQAAAFYRPAGERWGLARSRPTPRPGARLQQSARLVGGPGPPPRVRGCRRPSSSSTRTPAGLRSARSVGEAVRRAKACDPVSIYGGIVGVNRRLDLEVVKALSGILLEVLFAPEYEPDALEELSATKKKCRVFQLPCTRAAYPSGAVRVSQRARRPPGPGRGPDGSRSERAHRRVPAAAHRRRDGRAPVRLAGGQAREVQCHRPQHGRAGGRRGSGTDEPGRLRPHRRHARAGSSGSRRRGRCAPRTPSSPSATGSTSWPGRARRRCFIPEGRSETRR